MAHFIVKQNVTALDLEKMVNDAYGKLYKLAHAIPLDSGNMYTLIFEEFSPRKEYAQGPGGYRKPFGRNESLAKGYSNSPGAISPKQYSRLVAIGYSSGMQPRDIAAYIVKKYQIENPKDLPRKFYDAVCFWAENGGQEGDEPAEKAEAPAGGAPVEGAAPGSEELF